MFENCWFVLLVLYTRIHTGFYQFYYAVQKGLWFARSPEIATSDFIKTTSWLRIGPDIIFAGGAVLLVLFLIKGIWFSFIRKR